MRCRRFQFGVKILALAAGIALPAFCVAQNPHADRPPQHQAPAPQASPRPMNPNRPPANANRSPYNPPHPNQGSHNNFNNGVNNHNGARNGAGANYAPTPRQQLGVGAARPWVDQMRDLSPQQRERIKNDVLPRWRQMPWDRQQVIKQKLSVLQNMPESARNQRLNDPNFIRGLSDEERSTLRDLSHTHVGAPDPA